MTTNVTHRTACHLPACECEAAFAASVVAVVAGFAAGFADTGNESRKWTNIASTSSICEFTMCSDVWMASRIVLRCCTSCCSTSNNCLLMVDSFACSATCAPSPMQNGDAAGRRKREIGSHVNTSKCNFHPSIATTKKRRKQKEKTVPAGNELEA